MTGPRARKRDDDDNGVNDDRDEDERALVERARDDPQAFAELYRRHLPTVWAFTYRRCGNRPVAEDVTAATFERALRNLTKFRWHDRGFAPWLLRIAANELADHYRREHRRRTKETIATAGHRSTTPEPAEPTEPANEVIDALSALRPRYQEVLTLRYLADLDAEQVAGAVGVTRPHLAVLLMRARTALRRELDRGSPT